jgi:hypothetical protein
VKIVATACGTGCEFHTAVTGPVLTDITVAMTAQVCGLRNTVLSRNFRSMFRMAGYTVQCIDVFQAIGVARILELCAWMRILRFLAVLSMTVDAGILQHLFPAQRVGMTGSACLLQLVVTGRQITRHEYCLVGVIH